MTDTIDAAAAELTSLLELIGSDYRSPEYADDTYPLPLLRIERARSLSDVVRRVNQALVDDARASGHTWQEIAGALGMTRQAAHERFAAPSPRP